MSYIFANTVWPDRPIPQRYKALIAKLLEMGDAEGVEVGRRMAEEIFTPDGVLDHGSYMFEGKEAITNCRSKPKPGSQVISRRHHISRVYLQSDSVNDLVFLAELDMEFENGKVLHNKLASRAVFVESADGSGPRLSLIQLLRHELPWSRRRVEGRNVYVTGQGLALLFYKGTVMPTGESLVLHFLGRLAVVESKIGSTIY